MLRRCGQPEQLPMGGAVLRGALTESEQRWLYELLYGAVDRRSPEFESLRRTATTASMAELNPDNRPQPFVTWVHPYTRQSNATQRPTRLLDWAERLMHMLAPESQSHVVDSMLAQVYAPDGSLLEHRDEDLSWGLGVSLGCTAEFNCLPDNGEAAQRVLIRSGDILVGEFGIMPHSVCVPRSKPPAWWATVDTFGVQVRCNVLFRQALTAGQQRALAEQRARSVYGMTLTQLRERTGEDESFLAVHLRHAAKN